MPTFASAFSINPRACSTDQKPWIRPAPSDEPCFPSRRTAQSKGGSPCRGELFQNLLGHVGRQRPILRHGFHQGLAVEARRHEKGLATAVVPGIPQARDPIADQPELTLRPAHGIKPDGFQGQNAGISAVRTVVKRPPGVSHKHGISSPDLKTAASTHCVSVKFLNNVVEQDHRRIKRLTRLGLGIVRLARVWGPWRGVGEERDIRSVPRLPSSGRNQQSGNLAPPLLQHERAGR